MASPLAGPAGQFTYDAALAEDIRNSGRIAPLLEQNRQMVRRMYFTPWSPHAGEIFDQAFRLSTINRSRCSSTATPAARCRLTAPPRGLR